VEFVLGKVLNEFHSFESRQSFKSTKPRVRRIQLSVLANITQCNDKLKSSFGESSSPKSPEFLFRQIKMMPSWAIAGPGSSLTCFNMTHIWAYLKVVTPRKSTRRSKLNYSVTINQYHWSRATFSVASNFQERL